MRKTVLYLVILAILGIGVYYFLISKDNGSPYNTPEANFTIKDTAAIGKIYLAANDGGDITIERTDSGWMVNRTYHALPSTLYQLLSTFTKQEALYPVTKAAYDNVIKDMASSSIKVEVYDRAGKKMKVFYVGGASVNNSGTNMLIEGANSPYVVHCPGFVGYLTPQYATQMKDWRDRTVFNIPAEEIKSVSMQYADKPENSFVISRDNGNVDVTADLKVMSMPDGVNKKRAETYLHFFSNINCEGYINGLPDNDTTLKTAPKRAGIDIVGMHGQHRHVDIYWMELNRRSKNLTLTKHNAMSDIPVDYDADRMYAVANNYKDTLVVQQFVFRNIFRKAKEFYTKDVAPTPAQGK
jgi:hypothetical protein